jgi:G6PDH family F420-dependent oxidoreductase
MVSLGYFLSTEEFTPDELVQQAKWAEEAGFERLWISDHYHPWNHAQGQSPFVWGVIGALSQATSLPVTTAVTCPTVRIHPAVIAQAAATAATQLKGGFILGLGSGEALNEHILGSPWPGIDTRLEMLGEAIYVIRALFGGEVVEHQGAHYQVQHAQLYTLPDVPPPIYVSAFGPKAARFTGAIADGLISVKPDRELVDLFRENGGQGKPAQGGLKVCWDRDVAQARRTVHRRWPSQALPGELSQVLPTPEHFEQACELVTEDAAAETAICGPDADAHREAIQKYIEAGYDEVYISQIGTEQRGFFDFYAENILPRFAHATVG